MSKYAFQSRIVDRAATHLATAGKGASLLVASPTGSGKSYMEGQTHAHELLSDRTGYVIAPTVEILAGIYRKFKFGNCPAVPTREVMESHGFWTVKTLLNRARAGEVPVPDYMIFDEAHHSTDDTHTELWTLFGCPPRVGFTATTYRGTPAETRKLRAAWPAVETAITLPDAVKAAVIAAPSFTVWPLLNDDEIKVVNGEFEVAGVDAKFREVLDALVDRLVERYFQSEYHQWDRPTMVAVNSVAQVRDLEAAFRERAVPVVAVTGETSDRDRAVAFQRVVDCEAVLVQISVVGEGVDLPIRRLIDCGPTMSPVRFMQRLGRITRPTEPGEAPPEYVTTCHNLTRHAYLWHGVIPPAQVREAQQAWGPGYKPPRRSLARAIGLEGFGKFTVSPVPLRDGTIGSLYALQTKDGLNQYAVFLHPTQPDVLYAVRENGLTGETAVHEASGREYAVKSFGRWKRVDGIPDMDAVASVKPQQVTPNMLAWWQGKKGRGAEYYGLDPAAVPDARQFVMLPICADTKTRIVTEEGGQ
jgi:superfamily II DNA or RNA helicase